MDQGRQDEIMVPIKYGSDYRLARQIIQDVADEVVGTHADRYQAAWQEIVTKYRIESQRLEPTVIMVANENWIEFTPRFVVDFKLRPGTKDLLFWRILGEIDGAQGRVGLAASTLNIKKLVVEKLPVLEVRVARPEGPGG